MNYVLHLSNDCNMKCTYCYVVQNKKYMEEATAMKVIDNAIASGDKKVSIGFFGGEPLLCKPLIKKVIAYAEQQQKNHDITFYYKITTNGLLLDDDFIAYAKEKQLFVALSHDGVKESHDCFRKDNNNKGTYELVDDAATRLLQAKPYAPAMVTINKATVTYYAKNIEYLFSKGFKYLICTLNYDDDWDEQSMKLLEKEYKKLSTFYYQHTMKEDKFYFSPFEMKISSHINKATYCAERCELGKKQISVGPEGNYYPCVQFVGDSEWIIGNVDKGIDTKKRLKLYYKSEEVKDSCIGCALVERCNHYCGCINRQTTGSINKVSPVLCAHERIVIPIADRLAEKLYKKRNGLFIQKHYNEMYPLLSYIEDIQDSKVKKQGI